MSIIACLTSSDENLKQTGFKIIRSISFRDELSRGVRVDKTLQQIKVNFHEMRKIISLFRSKSINTPHPIYKERGREGGESLFTQTNNSRENCTCFQVANPGASRQQNCTVVLYR